jgi:hypothetical protein
MIRHFYRNPSICSHRSTLEPTWCYFISLDLDMGLNWLPMTSLVLQHSFGKLMYWSVYLWQVNVFPMHFNERNTLEPRGRDYLRNYFNSDISHTASLHPKMSCLEWLGHSWPFHVLCWRNSWNTWVKDKGLMTRGGTNKRLTVKFDANYIFSNETKKTLKYLAQSNDK